MIIIQLLRLYLILIVVRAVLSWLRPDPTAPLVRLLNWITEPALAPIRRILPPIGGRVDLSPMIAMIVGYWVLYILRF